MEKSKLMVGRSDLMISHMPVTVFGMKPVGQMSSHLYVVGFRIEGSTQMQELSIR